MQRHTSTRSFKLSSFSPQLRRHGLSPLPRALLQRSARPPRPPPGVLELSLVWADGHMLNSPQVSLEHTSLPWSPSVHILGFLDWLNWEKVRHLFPRKGNSPIENVNTNHPNQLSAVWNWISPLEKVEQGDPRFARGRKSSRGSEPGRGRCPCNHSF